MKENYVKIMPQIKDCNSQNSDKQQQPAFSNKQHYFDAEQWETDMKILNVSLAMPLLLFKNYLDAAEIR